MHQSPAVHLKKIVPGANSPFPMHRSGENSLVPVAESSPYPESVNRFKRGVLQQMQHRIAGHLAIFGLWQKGDWDEWMNTHHLYWKKTDTQLGIIRIYIGI